MYVSGHEPSEMQCEEFVHLIAEFLDGELSAEEFVSFASHGDTCSQCGDDLAAIRLTLQVVALMRLDSAPPDGHERLWQLFRDWKRHG